MKGCSSYIAQPYCGISGLCPTVHFKTNTNIKSFLLQ